MAISGVAADRVGRLLSPWTPHADFSTDKAQSVVGLGKILNHIFNLYWNFYSSPTVVNDLSLEVIRGCRFSVLDINFFPGIPMRSMVA
jgi:hypothetical protein